MFLLIAKCLYKTFKFEDKMQFCNSLAVAYQATV